MPPARATRPSLVMVFVLAGAPCTGAQEAGVASITPADVARRVHLLAHDSMGGRFTPSPELDRAAAYVAAELARLGLGPASDAQSFVQRYPLARLVPDTANAMLRVGANPDIRHGADAIHVAGRFTARRITAPAVMLTGSTVPDRPLAVGGKVVVAAVPTAGTGQPSPRARRLLRAVADAGPAAIVIPVDAPDPVWQAVVQQQFKSALGPTWEADSAVPVLQVRDRAIAGALAAAGVDLVAARRSPAPATVRPLSVSITLHAPAHAADETTAPNVAGLLRGRDPVLRDEVVVIGAHMDHVGVAGRGRCRAVGADSICNGADDNASGTVSVLELAEAFATAATRPRRSLLFVTVSGEERGLWGSDYFTTFPPVPMRRMVAAINLDMVGRNWRDTIAAIGREHSDLGATLARVESAHRELDMHAVGDLWPSERFFFRSDHYHFARRGVPSLFFFNGTHPDYHRPSDEPARIDAEKQARLTRLLYYFIREIADAPARPAWVPESYREIVGR